MTSVYAVNDTSLYHGGSFAVCDYISNKVKSEGHNIIWEKNKKSIEYDAIDQSDIVLVNGEGTLHHDKPRAKHIMNVLRYSQSVMKKTILCNTSWYQMGSSYDDVLRKLDKISVREIKSKIEMEDKHKVSPELALDASFWHKSEPELIEGFPRFMTTDIYSKEFDFFVRPMGGALSELCFLDMRNSSWQETLDKIASTKVLISGRFHGFMAACKVGTRFIVYPGNTYKIEGVLEWFGNISPLKLNIFDLVSSAKSSHKNHSFYSEFFDWMKSIPEPSLLLGKEL